MWHEGDSLDLLMDYTSGAAPQAVALAVATHIELSKDAAQTAKGLGAVGGALLASLPPCALAPDSLSLALAQLDDNRPEQSVARPATSRVPLSLQPFVGQDYDKLAWSRLAPGVEEYVLATMAKPYRTSLLRIAPGRAMPTHTHKGSEITVVLEGVYEDAAGRFERGDIELAGPDVTHKPIADASQGCVCLAVLSAPLHVTGVVGWFINPFLRH